MTYSNNKNNYNYADTNEILSMPQRQLLNIETSESHYCTAWSDQQQQGQSYPPQQRRYDQCNKGCGNEIYFDANNKSQSGKWIPLD